MFELRDSDLPGRVYRKKDKIEAAADALLNLSSRNGKKKLDKYPVLSNRQYERRREQEVFFGEEIENLPSTGRDYYKEWAGSIQELKAKRRRLLSFIPCVLRLQSMGASCR